MLLATTAGGGLFYWLGWLIAPRLTVAIIATSCFWDTNTLLVMMTWFWALGGESTEKKMVVRRARPEPMIKDAEVHSIT